MQTSLFCKSPSFLSFLCEVESCCCWLCVESTHPELINISLFRSQRSDKTACEPVGQTKPKSVFNELQISRLWARQMKVGCGQPELEAARFFWGFCFDGVYWWEGWRKPPRLSACLWRKERRLRASLPISNPALELGWPWICLSGGNRLRLREASPSPSVDFKAETACWQIFCVRPLFLSSGSFNGRGHQCWWV